MSYSFHAARKALRAAESVDGWADTKSAQLEREYLATLRDLTLQSEQFADDISAFITNIEHRLGEITRQ